MHCLHEGPGTSAVPTVSAVVLEEHPELDSREQHFITHALLSQKS